MTRSIVGAFAILVFAMSCGGSSSDANGQPAEQVEIANLPTGPNDVVLRMMVAANAPDPLTIVRAFPEFTLYGDGRIVLEDRAQRGGSVPGLLEARVSMEGMHLLVAEAARHGVLNPLDHYGHTDLADGDSTQFFVDTGDVQVGFSAYDVAGRSGAEGELTDEQVDARAELVRFRDALREFESLLGSEVIADRQAIDPDAVAVIAVMAREGGSDPAIELPFDLHTEATIIETRVTPANCLVVTGDQLDALMQVVAGEETGVFVPARSGGDLWTVVLRPVLPDEAGCSSLESQ